MTLIDRAGMAVDLYDMAARAWVEMIAPVRVDAGVGITQLIRFRDLRRHYKECLEFAKELSFP